MDETKAPGDANSETGEHPPLLSVTVLNYNYGRFLPTCLDSILSQTFKDFEVILINDKSTDDSVSVIQPYLKDARVRLVDHSTNLGFVGSLIEGVELSRGKYVTVISADDWVADREAFEKQTKLMESNPGVAFVYSAYGHYRSEGNREYVWRGADGNHVWDRLKAFEHLIVSPFLLHTGTVIRRSAYDQVGGYEKTYKYSVDTRMWLGLCHAGDVGYIDEPLYAYRRHDACMSKNAASFRKAIGELVDALEWSYAKWPADVRRSLAKQKRYAMQRLLVAFVLDDVFSNKYRSAWTYYWTSLKMHPALTLLQKASLVVLLRTIAGDKGWTYASRLRSRFAAEGRAAGS